MSHITNKKQSLSFADALLREIEGEATRQDRSLSWIVQQAWKRTRVLLSRLPNAEGSVPLGGKHERLVSHG